MNHLILFAHRMIECVQQHLPVNVSREFVEHMVIVGLLDPECDPALQVDEVVTQIQRAMRLGVWEQVA